VHATTLSAEQKSENKSVVINGQEIEWTKEGVEEILATVGVQCAYNSEVSPHYILSSLSSMTLTSRNQWVEGTLNDTPAVYSLKIEHSSSSAMGISCSASRNGWSSSLRTRLVNSKYW
jgi:hypothetical protein